MDADSDPARGKLPVRDPLRGLSGVVRGYRWQLTPGEDVIDTATWAGSVPQVNGIAPRVRVGRSRWFNLLWLLPIGFVLLMVAVAVAKGLRGDAAIQRFIAPVPGHLIGRRARGDDRVSRPGSVAALLQPVLHDLHHPRRHPDPVRSPPAVLDPAFDPGPGLVSDPKAGPGGPAVDGQAGFDQPSGPGRAARPSPLDRPGALVASERRRVWLLNGVIFYVLLFATGRWQRLVPDQLGRVSQRPVDADPVPVVELAGGKRLGGLQRPAADRLLRHRVHRRAARADHRSRACHPALSTRFSGSARSSASRPRARCTSSCSSGS